MSNLVTATAYPPALRQMQPSRAFNFRLALAVPLLVMLALLVFDPAPVDFAIAHWFYQPGSGFIGRNSYWLETGLHDRAKQVVIAFAVLVIISFALSFVLDRFKPHRATLGYLVLALALATSVVGPLKALTAVQCPWSLTDFGGSEIFSGLLEHRPPTDSPGRCWPGGHASSGFALLALFFALRDRRPRLAKAALLFALALGSVFSLGRMMQGAHFLSHNLWTLLIDWLICLLCYRWLLYRPAVPEQAQERVPQ